MSKPMTDYERLSHALTIVEDYLEHAEDSLLARSVVILYEDLGKARNQLEQYRTGNSKGGRTTQARLTKEERVAKAQKAGLTSSANRKKVVA